MINKEIEEEEKIVGDAESYRKSSRKLTENGRSLKLSNPEQQKRKEGL